MARWRRNVWYINLVGFWVCQNRLVGVVCLLTTPAIRTMKKEHIEPWVYEPDKWMAQSEDYACVLNTWWMGECVGAIVFLTENRALNFRSGRTLPVLSTEYYGLTLAGLLNKTRPYQCALIAARWIRPHCISNQKLETSSEIKEICRFNEFWQVRIGTVISR